ncbi:MAG: hypothetical protein PQJ44_08180 [Sphaerochaetaceae bacterium]|nr:hypothetical protein [Sphaerochaetaceae bacterium]
MKRINFFLLLFISSIAFADTLNVMYSSTEVYLYMRIDELKHYLGEPITDELEQSLYEVDFYNAEWEGLKVQYVIHADGPDSSFVQNFTLTTNQSTDLLGHQIGDSKEFVIKNLSGFNYSEKIEDIIEVYFIQDFDVDHSEYELYNYESQRLIDTEYHPLEKNIDLYDLDDWGVIQYHFENHTLTEIQIFSSGWGY